jgi:acylphosphatase
MIMNAAAHILVKGSVQGVGFRYFVQRHAERLGLFGYTRNLPSGQVEIEVEGDKNSILRLIGEVKRGPQFSEVFDVQVNWKDYQERFIGFEIRH